MEGRYLIINKPAKRRGGLASSVQGRLRASVGTDKEGRVRRRRTKGFGNGHCDAGAKEPRGGEKAIRARDVDVSRHRRVSGALKGRPAASG